ncbi:hypothetical protein HNP46_001578 [Pseudomonas nitritireducens]|uniref:Uncharacterized protein n=1 Tax=Pseudomonas nitroreducens TaxID=46680 RepID=A0A7W7KI24_PSENT|nr:hypothetical protein [Pseudomonas nitritireducens]MBB4862734.1 hypothetical protein [Pseudomonas nitritireducens]
MTSQGLRGLLCALLLGASGHLAAAELNVTPGGDVLGLPPNAPLKQFVERLGEPTARLPMRNGEQGLLYGNATLLVFKGQRLTEVRCWLHSRFTPSLFLGWLDQVEPGKDPLTFAVDGKVHLGQERGAATQGLNGLEGDGDELSDIRMSGESEIWLGYGNSEDYGIQGESHQVVVSLSVSMPEPLAAAASMGVMSRP